MGTDLSLILTRSMRNCRFESTVPFNHRHQSQTDMTFKPPGSTASPLTSVAATIFVAVLASVSAFSVRGQNVSALEAFSDATENTKTELIAVRHDIHQNPEISGQEKRTSALITQRLELLGWSVRERVGGYGVVATLKGMLPGERTIAFRADMDAVRSQDPDPVSYRSQTPGIRHICGHDVHTTIGLTLAEGFTSIRSKYGGTIMLLFQPAEESATGAIAMLEDDVFGTLEPDAIFAYHTTPYQTGQVATTPGGLMGSRDRLTVTISGSGNIDEVAADVRESIMSHSTVSPEESFNSVPRESIYIQMQRTARVNNSTRRIQSTVMLADADVRERLVQSLNDSLNPMENGETRVSLQYDRWIYGVTNDLEVTTRAVEVAKGVLGEDNVIPITRFVPAFSEDFGSFQDVTPGTMFFLGVSNEAKGWVGMPHSPGYVADDEAIFVGARTMAAIMLDALNPS